MCVPVRADPHPLAELKLYPGHGVGLCFDLWDGASAGSLSWSFICVYHRILQDCPYPLAEPALHPAHWSLSAVWLAKWNKALVPGLYRQDMCFLLVPIITHKHPLAELILQLHIDSSVRLALQDKTNF